MLHERNTWGKRTIAGALAVWMLLCAVPQPIWAAAGAGVARAAARTETTADAGSAETAFTGKKVSILSHSMSTYAGVSNNTAANSTIGNNDIYYTEGRLGVYQKDTWWQQVIDALGMELLVNNSWSGSCVFQPRKGAASVGYGDRAVNLHNDHTGEEPDIIFVYLGCNDFAYYKDTFGKAADIDYSALIKDNGDGTFTYAEPQTTCEAYAIMLHKVEQRYPDAEIFCMTSTARRDPDYAEDNYADAGQPTEYSAELHRVANYFGFPVINLENCIPKEAEIFDQYMGDKRAHANALGMDQITNEVLSVMLGKESKISHVICQDGTVQEQAVLLGGSYRTDVALQEGTSVVVTMGGQDVTADVYADGIITVETVTGDIAIHSEVRRDPMAFRWELRQDTLVSVGAADNAVEKLAGTVANGILSNTRYKLATPVVLKHNLPWEVEWQFAGNWRGCVFTSDPVQSTKDMVYLSRTAGGQLCMGTWTGKQHDNYGVDLSGLDDQVHTYRLENRISTDGSNMVWVYVDGDEIGPMNRYFIGSKDQGTTSDWLCGKDFIFSYISMDGHALKDCKLDYLQVIECAHTYKNGSCTGCGAAHSNLANYKGKVISILGGSNCTFAGFIPVADGFNLEHRSRYPDTSRIPDVTDVSQTWWMQLLTQMDAKLGINDSWAGSQVLNTLDSNSGDLGPDASMASLTRIQNLGANGTPDVILFFGGCNDIGRSVTLGSFDPATAPTQADLTATKWDSFADAYVAAITRMQHFYPNTKILVMLPYNSPTYFTASKVGKYGAVIRAICDHYGVDYVDLRDSGINSNHLPDNIHPNAEGSDYITTAVLDALLSSVELEAGEQIVHSVTHELTGAESSLGYYKGVSNGKSFATTITGENVTVTVTMGGVDITDQVYMDGNITIPVVTADVVITAKGVYNADGRLQQLPEHYCCNTNLWTLLEPVNEYYTASGWGNNSNSNYSVTFPVTVGDRIWATSFGAAGTNGYSTNAVRITWFGEDGVLKSLGRDVVYAEFAEYGYVTVPEGAVAVNIPMASNANTWEIYILNRDHSYENSTCAICGEAQPGPVITKQSTDVEATVGENFKISVEVEGEGLTYQWYFRNAGSNQWYKSSVKDNAYGDLMTVEQAGQEVYCVITDAYGNSVTTNIVTLRCAHTYTSVVTAPTCKTDGYTTHTCPCGDSYVDGYVDTTGEHSYNDGVCIWCSRSKLDADWLAPNFAEGDYSMVVLPDTQILVESWPESYYHQMQWIADHKDILNIQAVLHMGDMVNANNAAQWTVCENGTNILEAAGIPWMPMMGNHDDSAWFNQYYDYATYGTDKSWFGGSYHADKLDHTYWFVTVGTREYMILSLGWAPSWDVLKWAQGIVEANSDKNVILACHAYMNKDGTLLSAGDSHCVSSYYAGYPNGDDLWNAFKGYRNVVLAMGGHIHSPDVITYVDQNGDGRDVTSLLFDRQNDDSGSRLGMVGILTFHADSNTVDINWVSTRYDAFYKDKNQFPIQVPHVCDHNYTTVTTKPTCTEGGGTKYTCTLCGHSYVDEVTDALGHDWVETVTAPTCTEAGYTTLNCNRCGETLIKTIQAEITDRFVWLDQKMLIATNGQIKDYPYWIASDFTDILDCNRLIIKTANTANIDTNVGFAFYDADKNYISGVIHTDRSGVYGVLTHDIEVPENAAFIRTTWYSKSHPNYTEEFGEFSCVGTMVDEIAPTGHNHTSTVTPPTCTERGYTTHTCSCGDSYVDTYVPATGHSFTKYVSDGNATYEADGTKTALCDQGCGTKDTVADPDSMLFPEQVTSSIYDITGSILGKVPVGTTVSELLAGLDWGKYCTVFDANGKAMDASAKVTTGMVVKLMRGAEVKQTLTIAVRGDTSGDGLITITDFIQIKAHLLQKPTLSGAAATAADYSGDGSVTITDFMQMKALLLKETPRN